MQIWTPIQRSYCKSFCLVCPRGPCFTLHVANGARIDYSHLCGLEDVLDAASIARADIPGLIADRSTLPDRRKRRRTPRTEHQLPRIVGAHNVLRPFAGSDLAGATIRAWKIGGGVQRIGRAHGPHEGINIALWCDPSQSHYLVSGSCPCSTDIYLPS